MRSVGRYLQTRMLTGVAVILAGAGLVVFLLVARSLERQFDDNLADRIRGLASILFQTEGDVSFEFSDELMPEYDPGEAPSYFELAFDDGGLLEGSGSLGQGSLECPERPGAAVRYWSAPLPDGRAGRFASQLVEVHHVYPEQGPGRPTARSVSIVIARGTDTLRATKRAVLLQSAVTLVVIVSLLALLCHLAVRRGLEPTRRLASALDEVSMDALPERLEVGALPVELEPMARKADALIRRVAQAMERERRTTADIAHELRTPISEVLTVSEVALRGRASDDEDSHTLETIRDIASGMGRSVSTLLRLAWLETGGDSFDRVGVDIGRLVEDLLAPQTEIHREKRLRVINNLRAGELVESDPDVLRIILSNLLNNAFTYSPADAEVRIHFGVDQGAWTLAVENLAPDLESSDVAILSDPFWRKDRARSDRNRFGLGLALSAALAAKTELRLGFALDAGRFRASLGGQDTLALGNGYVRPA